MSNTTGIIDDKFKNAKHPYKPKKVSYRGNSIWIDPESKYDMKIIKCDSSKDIKFFETESLFPETAGENFWKLSPLNIAGSFSRDKPKNKIKKTENKTIKNGKTINIFFWIAITEKKRNFR